MAAIKVTLTDVSSKGDGSAMKAVWAAVTENDTFVAVSMPEYLRASVHISGTFGGGTVVLKGSNTGTNFFGLDDIEGTAISMTSEGLKQVQEGTQYFQPTHSGGSSSSITVTMLFVGPRRY